VIKNDLNQQAQESEAKIAKLKQELVNKTNSEEAVGNII